MIVLHSCQTWLPPTQNWIYAQISALPPEFESDVACRVLERPDLFPVPRLHRVSSAVVDAERTGTRRMGRVRTFSLGLRDRFELGLLARRRGVSVLHSHFGPIGWRDLAAARFSGAAHVVTFYGTDVVKVPRSNPHWYPRYRSLFRNAALILCEGEHMAAELKALGCPPDKVSVHRLGVDLGSLEFKPRRRQPGEPLRVLMAATFREKKGYEYALSSLGMLKSEFDFRFSIIGDGSAAARSRIEMQIQELGLQDRATLLGFCPHEQMIRQAQDHHIFLLPSVTAADGDTEGGAPVSIVEVMATGMPVVSTTHCDIPNVVVDGQTGFLAPERNAQELAAQIRRMFTAETRWPAMGLFARERVEREFNSALQGRRLGERYLGAVARQKSIHRRSA